MKKQVIAGILLSSLSFFATLSFGQVSINQDGSPPHSSAMLDINAEDKGILIPRVQLSGAQIADPIVEPPVGLIVFNVGPILPQGIYYWRGSSWTEFITGAEPFSGAAFAEIYEVNESGTTLNLSNNTYTPWNSAWQGAYDTRTGFAPQISSQYCRMERSEEKKPQRAVLRIDILIQRSRSA